MEYSSVDESFAATGILAGMDEVGRGCLAGPVVVAGVCWEPRRLADEPVYGQLKDSKMLRPKQREELARWIIAHAIEVRVAVVSHIVVDYLNILRATLHGFELACPTTEGDVPVLIDGNQRPHTLPSSTCVVHGDRRSQVIAAASIVAKTFRDDLMIRAADQFQPFQFDRNKGYGTSSHLRALDREGPTRLHRKSFAPVKALCPQPGAAEQAFLEDLAGRCPADMVRAWHRFCQEYAAYSYTTARRAVALFHRAGLEVLPTPRSLGPRAQ